MIDKDWDDIPYVDGDCVRDEVEWNDMVDYIRHSACTIFTIYGTCPSTNQAFKFTQNGTDSLMYGGDDAGDDLHIWGNDNVGAINIALLNTGEFNINEGVNTFLSLYEDGTNDVIEGSTVGNDLKIIGVEGIHNYFKAGQEFKLFDGATEAFKLSYNVNVTTFFGGSVAGDDLKFRANSVDARPYLLFAGGGEVIFDTVFGMYIQENGASFLQLYESGTDDVIEGKTVGNDLYLKPAGLLKWGTEQTNVGSDRGELIPMKTAAGTTVYLKTYDLV